MRIIVLYLISISSISLFVSCSKLDKEPIPCLTISNLSPKIGETVTISGNCSQNTKWADYELDGINIGSGLESFPYKVNASGEHTVTMTAYSRMNGTMNSRSGCSGCVGTGKSIVTSQKIIISADLVLGSNYPIHWDETLKLTASTFENANYSWNGPNNFTSTLQNPTIVHPTSESSGTYFCIADINGTKTNQGSVTVSILPIVPPCTTSKNICTYTGGMPATTITYISAKAYSDDYQVYAEGYGRIFTFKFSKESKPTDGLYTRDSQYYDKYHNGVKMWMSVGGVDVSLGEGNIFVTNNNGKISVTFCNISFTWNSSNYTISGNITEL